VVRVACRTHGRRRLAARVADTTRTWFLAVAGNACTSAEAVSPTPPPHPLPYPTLSPNCIITTYAGACRRYLKHWRWITCITPVSQHTAQRVAKHRWHLLGQKEEGTRPPPTHPPTSLLGSRRVEDCHIPCPSCLLCVALFASFLPSTCCAWDKCNVPLPDILSGSPVPNTLPTRLPVGHVLCVCGACEKRLLQNSACFARMFQVPHPATAPGSGEKKRRLLSGLSTLYQVSLVTELDGMTQAEDVEGRRGGRMAGGSVGVHSALSVT